MFSHWIFYLASFNIFSSLRIQACELSSPCQNGAETIIADWLNIKCKCINGWTGEKCTTGRPDSTISASICLDGNEKVKTCKQNFGTPSINGSFFKCTCAEGFYGPLCNGKYFGDDGCEPNPCKNGGFLSADPSSNLLKCQCADGYDGQNCEIFPCIDKKYPPSRCYAAWCTSYPPWAKMNCRSTCQVCNGNLRNAYAVVEASECASTLSNPCKNGGEFHYNLTLMQYTCICKLENFGPWCQGIITDYGVDCEINNVCKNGGLLEIMPGTDTYKCTCAAGYAGDYCQDYCTNPGLCGDISANDEAILGKGRENKNIMHLSGKSCLADDFQNPCKNGAKLLLKTNNVFSCSCVANFFGPTCESQYTDFEDTSCVGTKCMNGGVVEMNNAGGFQCQCKAGFYGRLCEYVCIDTGPAHWGFDCFDGLCIDDIFKHQCQRYCQLCTVPGPDDIKSSAMNWCVTDNPCENNGILEHIFDDNSYKCACPHGFVGVSCSSKLENMEDCLANNPCFNGGTFQLKKKLDGSFDDAKYICICPTGYSGDRCLQFSYNPTMAYFENINACIPNENPCQNRARLEIKLNKNYYYCHCDKGFFGQYCQFVSGIAGPEIVMTPEIEEIAVKTANDLRRKVAKGLQSSNNTQPPATNMKEVVRRLVLYNRINHNFSEENAETCTFSHSGWYFWTDGYAGENLWMSATRIPKHQIASKVESALSACCRYSEQRHTSVLPDGSVNCASTCESSQVKYVNRSECLASDCPHCKDHECAHYTYQIRHNFDYIGCGVAYCDHLRIKNSDGTFGGLKEGPATVIACGFGPTFNGGYGLYEQGEACSNCPASHPRCNDGLCALP